LEQSTRCCAHRKKGLSDVPGFDKAVCCASKLQVSATLSFRSLLEKQAMRRGLVRLVTTTYLLRESRTVAEVCSVG
jgi:hypothetical protein